MLKAYGRWIKSEATALLPKSKTERPPEKWPPASAPEHLACRTAGSAAPAPRGSFPFAALPAELRNHVYRHLDPIKDPKTVLSLSSTSNLTRQELHHERMAAMGARRAQAKTENRFALGEARREAVMSTPVVGRAVATVERIQGGLQQIAVDSQRSLRALTGD